jgi:small nuclear ribonucleoprotein (snRNP)-like protein
MSYWRLVTRRRVLVNLVSGRTVEGVLFKKAGPLLLVKDARVYERGANGAVPVDGEVLIERSSVDFIQAL